MEMGERSRGISLAASPLANFLVGRDEKNCGSAGKYWLLANPASYSGYVISYHSALLLTLTYKQLVTGRAVQ